MRILLTEGSQDGKYSRILADLRNQWSRYNPRKHLTPYENPFWPQLLPPIPIKEIPPHVQRRLDYYGQDEEIPPRFIAAATMTPSPWINRWERTEKAWAPLFERPARYVRDSIAELLAKPAVAISEAARRGSESFSRHAAEAENVHGLPSWQSIPWGAANSLPDLAQGAWKGLTEPGYYFSPGHFATKDIESPWLGRGLQGLIDFFATPKVLPSADFSRLNPYRAQGLASMAPYDPNADLNRVGRDNALQELFRAIGPGSEDWNGGWYK